MPYNFISSQSLYAVIRKHPSYFLPQNSSLVAHFRTWSQISSHIQQQHPYIQPKIQPTQSPSQSSTRKKKCEQRTNLVRFSIWFFSFLLLLCMSKRRKKGPLHRRVTWPSSSDIPCRPKKRKENRKEEKRRDEQESTANVLTCIIKKHTHAPGLFRNHIQEKAS